MKRGNPADVLFANGEMLNLRWNKDCRFDVESGISLPLRCSLPVATRFKGDAVRFGGVGVLGGIVEKISCKNGVPVRCFP